MLIESLIRLGRPMVEGGISSRQILHQVSDVAAVNAKSFLANVFVVEIDSSSDGVNIEALPVQEWGEYQLQQPNSKKQVFYGVPAYLVYDKHFQAFVRETEEVCLGHNSTATITKMGQKVQKIGFVAYL